MALLGGLLNLMLLALIPLAATTDSEACERHKERCASKCVSRRLPVECIVRLPTNTDCSIYFKECEKSCADACDNLPRKPALGSQECYTQMDPCVRGALPWWSNFPERYEKLIKYCEERCDKTNEIKTSDKPALGFKECYSQMKPCVEGCFPWWRNDKEVYEKCYDYCEQRCHKTQESKDSSSSSDPAPVLPSAKSRGYARLCTEDCLNTCWTVMEILPTEGLTEADCVERCGCNRLIDDTRRVEKFIYN